MHPIITRDLMKAWITDLYRQAKQNAPLTPADTIAELTGRAHAAPFPQPLAGAPTAAGQASSPRA